VDFIEHDLVRVADAPESGDEGQSRDDDKHDLVVAFLAGRRLGGGSFHELIELDIRGRAVLGLLGRRANIPLAQSALRRRRCHGG
jgi:hypothetical protein